MNYFGVGKQLILQLMVCTRFSRSTLWNQPIERSGKIAFYAFVNQAKQLFINRVCGKLRKNTSKHL